MYALGKENEKFDVAFANAKLGYVRAFESKTDLCVCTPELLRNEESRNILRSKLDRAIDNKEFDLFLQFVYSPQDEKFIGAEVLSRWNSPLESFITPAYYINDMRTTGVIVKFDYYMLEKTCRLLEKWKNIGYGDLDLSCNITRITISADDFVQKLHSIAGRYDFDHSKLLLEITEDAFVNNHTVAYRNIVECKKAGFRIALDDFGAGNTSFNDLCDYPVDIIKVDRSIIQKITTKRGDALVKGLVTLAHGLNIEVLAEGVETEEEEAVVVKCNCDYIQGYFHSYVLSLGEAMEFYNKSIKALEE